MTYKSYDELLEELKIIKEEYFKIRRENLSLVDKLDDMEIEKEQRDELIEKTMKELAYKTELLAEYHLKFGQECLEIIEKKRSRIRKRKAKNKMGNDDEGVELI
ncbi:hypothetical protein [Sarcina ventriculi]